MLNRLKLNLMVKKNKLQKIWTKTKWWLEPALVAVIVNLLFHAVLYAFKR